MVGRLLANLVPVDYDSHPGVGCELVLIPDAEAIVVEVVAVSFQQMREVRSVLADGRSWRNGRASDGDGLTNLLKEIDAGCGIVEEDRLRQLVCVLALLATDAHRE